MSPAKMSTLCMYSLYVMPMNISDATEIFIRITPRSSDLVQFFERYTSQADMEEKNEMKT